MYRGHKRYLERYIKIFKHAREIDNTPFRALLTDEKGTILLEQKNVEMRLVP